MRIKLKSLSLGNYKKFEQLMSFEFFDRTKISGKNKEGKSTLENAYMEILTGKEVDGTQPDGIRPCGTDSKDLNRADVIREVTLDIDGKETTIRKITKQKWRKPHGQTEDVLDGNTTSFEVKGYTADQNIEVMACNYLGEAFLKDESSNLLYDIKRTYRKDKSGTVILTCQRREDGKF